MGFVSLGVHSKSKITDSEYKIEYLFDGQWQKVASVDYFKVFVDSHKLDRICLLQKQKENKEGGYKLVETFIPLRMSVIVFDKIQEKWTFSYLTGPVIENAKENVEIKGWNGTEWLEFDLEETTENETNQLIPQKSSFLVSLKKKNENPQQQRQEQGQGKEVLFLLRVKQAEEIMATCEWSMPAISNTRWVMNEILAPLAATSTIALVTSVLFPNTVKDVKTALAWSIPGWLLLDGTCIFKQVMNGTTAQLNPIQVKVRDPSFWIKAVATGMGPLLVAAQTSMQNSLEPPASVGATRKTLMKN